MIARPEPNERRPAARPSRGDVAISNSDDAALSLDAWSVERTREVMSVGALAVGIAHVVHALVALALRLFPLAGVNVLAAVVTVLVALHARKPRNTAVVHVLVITIVLGVALVAHALVTLAPSSISVPLTPLIIATTAGNVVRRRYVAFSFVALDSVVLASAASVDREHLATWMLALFGANVCGVLISESRRTSLASTFARERLFREANRIAGTKTRELEIANQASRVAIDAKQTFLAHMSHEIRTPLTGILGLAELIDATRLPPEPKRQLEQLRRSADQLLATVNDVLDMAKIEAGGLEVVSARIDVADLLGEVVALVLPLAPHAVNVSWCVDEDVPRVLVGDSVRLRQVLLNLANNAIRFTTSGEVELRARTQNRSLVVFEVRDTGPGIANEDRERIFAPFVQAAPRSSTGGTGLGLAIARELAFRMGCSIEFDSVLGAGSSFRLVLPKSARDVEDTGSARSLAKSQFVIGVAESPLFQRHLETGIRYAGCAGMAGSPAEVMGWLASDDALLSARSTLVLATQATFEQLAPRLERLRATGLEIVLLVHPGERPHTPLEGLPTLAVPATAALWQRTLRRARARSTRRPTPSMISEMTAEAAPRRAREGAGPILVVDDNATNRMVVEGHLTAAGYTVELALTGEEALRRCQPGHALSLVLMDVGLPDRDGDSVIEAIRAMELNGNARRVPIIALTAHVLERERQRVLTAGADAFVGKPFRASELLDTIDAMIESCRPSSLPPTDALVPLHQPPLLDATILDDLRALDRRQPGFANVLVRAFRTSGDEHLTSLELARSEGRTEDVRRTAHLAAGAAAQVGGARLAGALRAIERDPDDAPDETKALLRATVRALEKALDL